MTSDEVRVEELEDTLRRIKNWCDAYPISIFVPITDDELKRVDKALADIDVSMSGLHGQWSRHILSGIRDIITMVLPD